MLLFFKKEEKIASSNLTSHYKHHRSGEDAEHCKVKEREEENIFAALAGVVLDVLAEGNKACERGDERTCAADIDADEQLGVVAGELREQDRRGHVTDALAGKHADEQGVLLKQGREDHSNALDARHIARKDKEENKSQKQRIVNVLQCLSVHGKDDRRDNDQSDKIQK